MTTRVGPGKMWGMRRLADANGRFKMVAIDQRTPIFTPLAKLRGTTEPQGTDIAAVKRLLARHLAPGCSAILIDPNYGYLPAIAEVPAHKGLILSYEHHVTVPQEGGRTSVPIPGWDVARIRRSGGDAVKLLVWHRADAPDAVRAHQEAFVRACGEACRANDIVFLLEVLVYPLDDENPAAFAANRTNLVLDSIRPFTAPEYGVDIFKLEPPGPIHNVPDPNGPGAAALQAEYDRMATMLPGCWVLLSAGGSAADFARSLQYAYRAGASGYLAGRAIWWDAFTRYPDLAAFEGALSGQGMAYLEEINLLTDAAGLPWMDWPALGGVALDDAGWREARD